MIIKTWGQLSYTIAAFYKWVLIYSFKVSSEEPPSEGLTSESQRSSAVNLVMCSGSRCPQRKSITTFLLQWKAGSRSGFTSAIFPSPYFHSRFLVILEPKRHLPCWHFIIHNGLIYVDISWRSFSSYGFLSPLMNPHMATSGSCTYPNWLAAIINCFPIFLSDGESPRVTPPPHRCAVMPWSGLLQPRPKDAISAIGANLLWALNQQSTEGERKWFPRSRAVTARWRHPATSINHPPRHGNTHARRRCIQYTLQVHAHTWGKGGFVRDDIDAVKMYFYSFNCGSDRVLHATRSLAQVSCAEPCRLSGVPTDGCSERLWMHIVWIKLHAMLSRCSASEVFQSAASFA